MGRYFHNAFITACFTVLALYFGEWWIVFFSAIFYDWREKGTSHDEPEQQDEK